MADKRFSSGQEPYVNTPKRIKREERQIKAEKSAIRSERSQNFKTAGGILGIVLAILLLVAIIRTIQGGSNIPSFTGFLQMLTDVPTVTIPFIDYTPITLGDWGLFNFLRDFVATLAGITNFLIFLVNGCLNIVQYIVYFFRWIFVG